MRIPSARALVAALVASSALAFTSAPANLPAAPDGQAWSAASEHIFLGGGCVSTGATCDETGYWIGLDFGDSSPATLTHATPANAVTHLSGDAIPYESYPADDSLQAEYVLDASRTITGQVMIRGSRNAQFTTASAMTGVHIRLTGQTSDYRFLTLETVIERPYSTHLDDSNVFEFELEIPAEWDGVAVGSLAMEVGVRGIHAYTYGFVNAEGGSWFDLPYYELVDAR